MPELSVVIIATDSEQRAVLQVLVDGTSVARTVHNWASFPMAATDPMVRRIQSTNPAVILVDIPVENAAPAVRAIELLHQDLPQCAIFAIGTMSQPQVIVNTMRAGAREFIERPTTTTDLLEAFVRLTVAQRQLQWSPPRPTLPGCSTCWSATSATWLQTCPLVWMEPPGWSAIFRKLCCWWRTPMWLHYGVQPACCNIWARPADGNEFDWC